MSGFIAQAEEYFTGVVEVMGSNPIEATDERRLLKSSR